MEKEIEIIIIVSKCHNAMLLPNEVMGISLGLKCCVCGNPVNVLTKRVKIKGEIYEEKQSG